MNNNFLNSQKHIFKYFEKAIKNNKLANCFLFINKNVVKTDKLIKEIIKIINGNNSLSNIITFDKENILDKNNVNNIIEFCHQKSTIKTIIYIKNIDQISEQVANSLLKLMENLNNYYIIMSCSKEEDVIDTIVSRSQKIYLETNNKIKSNNLIDNLGISEENYEVISSSIKKMLVSLFKRDSINYQLYKNELLLSEIKNNQTIIFETIINLLNNKINHDLNKSSNSKLIIILKNILKLYSDFQENNKKIFIINMFIVLEEGII